MAYGLQSPGDFIRLGVNAVLVGVGLLITFGIITFPVTNFWFPWLLTLIGVMLVSIPRRETKLFGAVAMLLGVYLILRYMGVISLPLLGYGLGGMLILTGAVNLVRDAKGGSDPINKTISK